MIEREGVRKTLKAAGLPVTRLGRLQPKAGPEVRLYPLGKHPPNHHRSERWQVAVFQPVGPVPEAIQTAMMAKANLALQEDGFTIMVPVWNRIEVTGRA